jgi:hypothetical protein
MGMGMFSFRSWFVMSVDDPWKTYGPVFDVRLFVPKAVVCDVGGGQVVSTVIMLPGIVLAQSN